MSAKLFLATSFLIILLIVLAAPITAAPPQQDPFPTIRFIPGTVNVDAPIALATRAALARAGTVVPSADYFAISESRVIGDWVFISIVGLKNVGADLKWNFIDHATWFGVVLLARDATGAWSGAVEGTGDYSRLLANVPDTLLDSATKQMLDPLRRPTRAPSAGYPFPWQSGKQMYYGVRGLHDAGFITGWKAVDFLSDGDTGAGHAPNSLRASEAGSISYVCNDGTSVAVRINNLLYVHLLYNGNLYTGKYFNQGDEIGQLKPGTFSANCGWADQQSNWFHVHWGFPNTGSFVAEDWTLSFSDGLWRKGSETRGTGSWFQAGGSTPPANCSYTSDQIVLWEHPNYSGACKTFNIGEYADPGAMGFANDSASSIQVGSNVIATLCRDNGYGTCWNFDQTDSDLGNDPLGDNQVSSLKVVAKSGGGCNYNADQIVLYEHPNYSGTCKVLNIGEYTNPGALGFPNDAASSLRVGGNVKATLCRDDNYGGGCEDFTGDDPDLNGNGIGDNQVSSAKVQSRGATNCSYDANQIVLYEHPGYSGQCKMLGIGDYPNPGALGFPNDMVSAIRVGGNVQAQLCSDDNYSGTCENFSGDDSDFSDNAIGHDRTSSVRVQTRVQPPGAPSLTSPSNGATFNEGDVINLAWSATGDQYYGEIWGGPATLTFGWQAGTSNNIGAQWAGYTYAWHVKAKNGAGESGWSSTFTFTIKPRAPASLSATVASCSQINLAWSDNSGNEEGYRIYRDGTYLDQVGAGVTSYQNSGLNASTNYAYTVKAYRGTLESDASNPANATTTACVTPKPDLRPLTKSGYTYPVVPSSIQGTHTANTLYGNAITFFDWFFINSGNATASNNFYVEVWVDATRYVRYPYSNWGAGWEGGFDDWSELVATPGWHTLKIITDPDNTIDEADESNNVWQQQFYWTPINAWKGEYWKNTTYTGNPWLTRDDASLDFEWLLDPPDPSLPGDGFAARWTRTVNFPAGAYRFTIFHDDGARLFIDDVQVFGNWCSNCRVQESVDVTLTAGNHTIKMEMWDNGGWASARLTWDSCYTLTKAASPTGGGTLNANVASNCASGAAYTNGTNLVITASANAGYVLQGWSGCTSSSGATCNVTMNGNKNIIATFSAVTPPSNDDWANAIAINGMPFTLSVDTRGASQSGDDPVFPSACITTGKGSSSVWFRFTPNANGMLTANTLGSNYDTVLAVWSGARGNLVNVKCDDDSGGSTTSALTAPLSRAVPYYIEVADWRQAGTYAPAKNGARAPSAVNGGTLSLNLSFAPTNTWGPLFIPLIRR